MHRRDDVRVAPPAFSSRSPFMAVLSALFDSLSLSFSGRGIRRRQKRNGHDIITQNAFSLALPLLKSNSSSVNEKKHYLLVVVLVLLLLHAFVWVCALSLSLGACARVCVVFSESKYYSAYNRLPNFPQPKSDI